MTRLDIEFVTLRENIDTGGPLGRAVVVIIGAIAELERSLIVERVRAGMRRANLEGRHIGRKPLDIDRHAILRDRNRGLSLGELAKLHRVSRTSIARVLKDAVPKGVSPSLLQLNENRQPNRPPDLYRKVWVVEQRRIGNGPRLTKYKVGLARVRSPRTLSWLATCPISHCLV